MPGLLDVAPSNLSVTVNGTEVSVPGVAAEGIAVLLSRFPALRALLTGRKADVSAESLTSLVPEAIAAVIAAGTGSPGDADAEAIASKLPLATQLEFIDKIVDATMPEGVGPFVAAFERLGLLADSAQGVLTKEPDGNSPKG